MPKTLEELQKENEELQKQIEEKDKIIEQKNKDVIGARKKYKKLADMTEEEKAELSQRERELMERQEKIEEQEQKRIAEQQEREQKVREDKIQSFAKQLAGGDDKKMEKIIANFNRFNDSKEAFTDSEIQGLVTDAYKLTTASEPAGDPIGGAHNAGGGPGKSNTLDSDDESFADTEDGKEIAKTLGLQVEEEGGDDN